MTAPTTNWLSTNSGHMKLPNMAAQAVARFSNGCHDLFPGRITRQTMIRYQTELERLQDAGSSTVAVLTPLTSAFMHELELHPWRKQPQMQTAFHLWEHGLRSGYVWIENGKPLCMQWLFSESDNSLLKRLPEWSGLYLPLAEDCGQVENILTFPAGLRRRGGAAIDFARSMQDLAASKGMRRLVTHISVNNGAAQKWAKRMGWRPCGYIYRYQIDLPWLRRHPIYLHVTAENKEEGALSACDEPAISANKNPD